MPRLTSAALRQAAALLAEALSEGRPLADLPESCRPSTPAAGQRIAAHVLGALGLVPVGLRLAPAAATQDGANRAVAGPIVETRLLHAPAALPPAMPAGRRVTLAVLAQLGSRLPARARPYRAAELLRRIASLHVALDLAESRFAEGPADIPLHLADLAGLGLVVFGAPARAGWRTALGSPRAAAAAGASGEAWRGTVDAVGALVGAAEAARRAGGLPEGALLLAAGLSPPLPDGALKVRIGGIGTVERLA